MMPEEKVYNDTEEKGIRYVLKSLPYLENTIRLFDRGEYFSTYGEHAIYVANNVFKTTSALKYMSSADKSQETIPVCTLGKLQAESFIRDGLLNRQLKIEIWATSGNPTSGTPSRIENSSWRLIRRGSPGSLGEFEDILFSHDIGLGSSPVIMALIVISGQSTGQDNVMVAVAFADTTSKILGYSEFSDNELFSNLESALIQLNVKECIVPSGEMFRNLDLEKIRSIIERCNVVITEAKRGDFQKKDVEQDLSRLLDPKRIGISFKGLIDKPYAAGCLQCLIKYMDLMSDEINFGTFTLRTHDLKQYMKLDAAAVKAMNLFPSARDGSNKTKSLFGLLNHCQTAQGSRLLRQWLSQPLLDVYEIERRLDFVQLFFEETTLRRVLLEEHFRKMPDFVRLSKKFQRGRAHLQDVVRLYQAVIKLPDLIQSLQTYDGGFASLLEEHFIVSLRKSTNELENFKQMVESTIDLAKTDFHVYHIKPEFDVKLRELCDKMNEISDCFPNELEKVSRELSLEPQKKLKLENNSQYGYYFRISRNDSSRLRNGQKYIELTTQKNGIYFTTSSLKSMSDKHCELSRQYDSRQSSVVKEIVSIAASYASALETLNQIIAELDVLVSIADASLKAPVPYIRPKISSKGNGDIILKSARHPCLEVQDDISFIPNDISLLRNRSSFHIITGPNMGGKSTFIRQVATIVLMAQIGCFVPCSEAHISILDCILARVGAGDSQLKGISTFMAEMLETASILESATEDSLIVIDELGRGTSTYDGFGLAWAISEYIASHIRCFCLFATHFHELTDLASQIPAVANFHVTAQTTNYSITLLYKVLPGICDQSFGIHVAELAKFPSDVIKLAKKKAFDLERGSSDADSEVISNQQIQEGEQIVQDFLNTLSTLDVPAYDLHELVPLIEVMKQKITNLGHPFINKILTEL